MTESKNQRSSLIAASLMIIAMVHISIALIYAKSVLIPFTLAIFIALLVSPVMDFLIKKFKLPSAVALALTILLVITFLFLLYIFFSYAIQTIVATADNYSVSFIALMEKTFEYLRKSSPSPSRNRYQKLSPAPSARSWAFSHQQFSSAYSYCSCS